jgi:hypothetical protein
MKIAFVGDSFCADIKKGGWPLIVAETFNADIIANGIGGRHLFHSYERLLEVVDEADYIIFCIAEPYRMPNKHGMHITTHNYSININGLEHLEKKLKTFHKLYYNDFISWRWHEISQKGLLMQIDQLMIEKKKKCIWLPSFDDSMQGFIPKSGPITDVSLLLFSDNELSHLTDKQYYKMLVYDPRHNHFDVRNNRNMAKLIIDIINNDSFSQQTIKIADYFNGNINSMTSRFHNRDVY